MLHPQAIEFLKSVQELMGKDDFFFVGFDQKKNPQTVLDAYNDKTGITEAFNKNVLTRINTEMDGDFDLDRFFTLGSLQPRNRYSKKLFGFERKAIGVCREIEFKSGFPSMGNHSYRNLSKIR